MKSLLEAAEVDRSSRFRSQQDEHVQCAMSSTLGSVCLPAPGGLLGGSRGGRPAAYGRAEFAVTVRMERSLLCRTASPVDIIEEAVEVELEKAAGRVLWFGDGTGDIWLGNPSASTVGADATLGDLLAAFYRKTVGLKPTVHMGIKIALEHSWSDGKVEGALDADFVVSPGYPPEGLAVTGPVRVWAEDAESIEAVHTGTNEGHTEATILAALSYDPCSVVVRGDLPVQSYVGTSGSEATAYVTSDADRTVSWGDGSPDTTVEAGTDSGVTHDYSAPGEYTITIGTTEYVVEIKE